MKVELLEVAGIYSAIRSMRYPHKSSAKSDSVFQVDDDTKQLVAYTVGPKDLKLAQGLLRLVDESHSKAFRGVLAWLEITAPRYFWQEMDTYTIGVIPLSSESTMHRILKDEITVHDFEEGTPMATIQTFMNIVKQVKIELSQNIINLIVAKAIVKKALPESYLQKRVRAFSYITLKRIKKQRRNHELAEWSKVFCPFIDTLPLAKEIII